MNSEHSYLYDPKALLSITLNGQLTLAMMCEQIVNKFDVLMIQVNTDGVTFKAKRSDVEAIKALGSAFEKSTGLTLEYATYSAMHIVNVNNYIAEYEGSSYVKLKGLFEIDRDFHKNHSKRIVPLALAAYFIKGIDPAVSIRDGISGISHMEAYKSHGLYDYMICKKANGKFQNVKCEIVGNNYKYTPINGKLLRYIVVNRGDVYLKENTETKTYSFHEKHPARGKTWQMLNTNDVTSIPNNFVDINYTYYLRECNKVISLINKTNNQTSLF